VNPKEIVLFNRELNFSIIPGVKLSGSTTLLFDRLPRLLILPFLKFFLLLLQLILNKKKGVE